MKVPYANAHFPSIREENYFYVDKTPFIARLENLVEKHLVFLRPRRFGKSTLISTLASYYDIAAAGNFDKLFGGLWIHEHPTPKKNAYLVLRFDFSPVASEGTPEEIRKSFAVQIKESIYEFVSRYAALIPQLSDALPRESSNFVDASAWMTNLCGIVSSSRYQIYVLIDEYDSIAAEILSASKPSASSQLRQTINDVATFYTTIKAFAGTSTIARTFITGVCPVVLDGSSGGFNIITHLSPDDRFNALVGFTREEVERAVDMLIQATAPRTDDPRLLDKAHLLEVLERYYDGYRFSKYAKERMYNSTLVLYFLKKIVEHARYPEQMLDLNARTDYGRLYGLAKAATEHESGVRTVLEQVLTTGEVRMPLVEQFGTRFPFAEAQVTSLFYYMGMLTFGPEAAKETVPTLVIPNRVMRELQWEYMGYALADQERVVVDMSHIEQALSTMAIEGDIRPLLQIFTKEVLDRISNRDLGKFNEKIMKLMLMAYLCQTRVFSVASELEMKQGYCDLLLGLRSAAMHEKFAWIIEAKYVAVKAKPDTHTKAVEEAYAQIDKYMSDQALVQMLTLGREIKAGVMVFVGSKRIDWYPWPRPEKPKATRATKKAASRAG